MILREKKYFQILFVQNKLWPERFIIPIESDFYVVIFYLILKKFFFDIGLFFLFFNIYVKMSSIS